MGDVNEAYIFKPIKIVIFSIRNETDIPMGVVNEACIFKPIKIVIFSIGN